MVTPSLRRKFHQGILPAGSSLRKTNSQQETSNLATAIRTAVCILLVVLVS